MLSDGLFSLLSAAGSITAIVGQSGIWIQQMPEGSPLPAIVFSLGDEIPVADSHDGPDPLHEARVTFTCHGKTGRAAKLLQVTLRRFLEGYQGTLSDGTTVGSVIEAGAGDAFSYQPFSYQASIEFRILYRDVGSLTP